MQLVLTIFYLVWLIAVLIFLGLIYRQTRDYIRGTEHSILQTSEVAAAAALKSAEAANRLAEMLEAKDHHA